MKTSIITLPYSGDHILVTDEQAAEFREDVLKYWEFEHDGYTADVHLSVGRLLVQPGPLNMEGISDYDVVMTARGKAICQLIVKGWNRKTDDGAEVPITPETIGSLPPRVLRRLAEVILVPVIPSVEELEALKKKPSTNTEAI